VLLDGIAAQADLARVWEARVVDATMMLHRLRDRLDEIEATNDTAAQQEIMAGLVQDIRVTTVGAGRDKEATVTIRYVFGRSSAVDTTASTRADNLGTG
jgi:hypothetical protein